MSNDIKDIFNSIKERVSNPFIFSFLGSWVLINWRIIITIILYDPKQIEKAGYQSIYKLIEETSTSGRAFWLPLSFAIGYVITVPLIKIAISGIQAFSNKWSDELQIRVLKNSNIPTETYLNLKDSYKIKVAELAKIIREESHTQQMLNNSESDKIQISTQYKDALSQKMELENELKDIVDVTRLSGQWTVSYQLDSPQKPVEKKYDVKISNYDFQINEGFNSPHLTHHIINYFYNSLAKQVVVVLEKSSNDSINIDELLTAINFPLDRLVVLHFHILNTDLLKGKENGLKNIRYTRIREDLPLTK